MTKKINLKIKGMHCKSCEAVIKMVLEDLSINECTSDYIKGTATITFDESKTSLEQIKSAIKKEGYEVN